MQDLPNHGLELNISHIVNLLEDQGARCLSGTLGGVYESRYYDRGVCLLQDEKVIPSFLLLSTGF